jgi:hypothetical protein
VSLRARTIHGAWRCAAAPASARFQRALADPERVQRRILHALIGHNANTRFGREHGFDRVDSVDAFRERVPIRTYDELKPWIDAAADGKPGMLTRDPITAFLPTSGTSTGRKLIPWTASLHREFQEAIQPWVHGFMRETPEAWRGRAYWSVSPPSWTDDRTGGGIPIGFDADTAYLAGFLKPLVNASLAVPSAVAGLREAEDWNYVTLAFLLAAADLSMISVWSPTFLTTLLEPLAAWWPRLLSDLELGALSPPGAAKTKSLQLERQLGRHIARARTLSNLSPRDVAVIWPRLAGISCWTDAAARDPSRELARLFPQAKIVGKGLVATEGIVSIPVPGASAPALALMSHFLEFIRDDGNVCGAWDLSEGEEYSVVLTTGGGLYRYRLNDRIRVVGFIKQCPLVEFIGREGIVCDLCGEKLAEPFVRSCLDKAARSFGSTWSFAMLAPADSTKPQYVLFVAGDNTPESSHIALMLDESLCQNVHYAHARRIGQLGCIRTVHLPRSATEAWARYQQRLAAEGARIGDIKPAALDPRAGWERILARVESASIEPAQ